MAAWKTLVFPCLLVSATLIVALPQRGSQVIENAGTSLFEKEINYLAIDPSPPQNNLTGQPFSQKEGIRDKRDQINIIINGGDCDGGCKKNKTSSTGNAHHSNCSNFENELDGEYTNKGYTNAHTIISL